MNLSLKGVGLAGMLLLSTAASATLIDRGNGLIYDDVLDLTWMQDANYAGTQGYGRNGAMTWDDAMAWADSLVYEGFDDWRLPTMVDTGNPGCDFAQSGTDCGYDVLTTDGSTVYSEMASLWFDTLGNPTSGGVVNTGPFQNVQVADFNDYYWLDQEYAPRDDVAWSFYTYNALQFAEQKHDFHYAWVVRSGDVTGEVIASATASVPEPGTALLLGGGLVGLLGFMRKKK